MIVNPLYRLQPKTARFESVYKQNPMNNNRVLCGFLQYLGMWGVNPCISSGVSDGGNPVNARAKIGQGGGRD